jgi:hypothetical protein
MNPRRPRGPLLSCAAALSLAAALAGAARADAPAGAQLLSLKETTLSYRLVHPLHKVKGTCREAEGRAAVTPGQQSLVQVRAKVACFDSGDNNRDVHMREVTHEALHPFVTVKGTLEGLQLPLSGPTTLSLSASVELNGEKQQVSIPLQLKPEGSGLRGTFQFDVSLEGFKIERPSLVLAKVEDRLTLEGELLFQPQ